MASKSCENIIVKLNFENSSESQNIAHNEKQNSEIPRKPSYNLNIDDINTDGKENGGKFHISTPSFGSTSLKLENAKERTVFEIKNPSVKKNDKNTNIKNLTNNLLKTNKY